MSTDRRYLPALEVNWTFACSKWDSSSSMAQRKPIVHPYVPFFCKNFLHWQKGWRIYITIQSESQSSGVNSLWLEVCIVLSLSSPLIWQMLWVPMSSFCSGSLNVYSIDSHLLDQPVMLSNFRMQTVPYGWYAWAVSSRQSIRWGILAM